MNNRKSYNSIFFLTVYLGLVLVGASPQVLANAATNSLFDLRNEIEFKDDLDNKPDEACFDVSVKTTDQDGQFIAEYIKLVSASLERIPVEINLEMMGGIDDPVFPSLREEFSINFFKLKLNNDGFFSKLSFSSGEFKKTVDFVHFFNQRLKYQFSKSQNIVEKVVVENTEVISVDNQIFIITNLPRASIDSLLKQSALSR